MPKSKEFVSSDSDSSGTDQPKAKKKKSESKTDKGKSKSDEKAQAAAARGPGGEYMFDLAGSMKHATVSEFKGKVYVGIREYYEKDGKLLPGKKGISLTGDQWRSLKSLIPDVDECLKKF